jgi:hypothetical protein
LGLECLENAFPFLLDNKVLDGGPFRPAFGAGLNEDFRHDRVSGLKYDFAFNPVVAISFRSAPWGLGAGGAYWNKHRPTPLKHRRVPDPLPMGARH